MGQLTLWFFNVFFICFLYRMYSDKKWSCVVQFLIHALIAVWEVYHFSREDKMNFVSPMFGKYVDNELLFVSSVWSLIFLLSSDKKSVRTYFVHLSEYSNQCGFERSILSQFLGLSSKLNPLVANWLISAYYPIAAYCEPSIKNVGI